MANNNYNNNNGGSSSSCSSDASSSGYTYDAFLSFRGADVRYDFGDWLYNALLDAGLRTFRDDDDINKGNRFDRDIRKAITESKVAIIIFSEGFASSTYCLEEVARFLDRWKREEVKLLPVFFKVEPDPGWVDEGGVYGEALKRHEQELELEERLHQQVTTCWDILRGVADLFGQLIKKRRVREGLAEEDNQSFMSYEELRDRKRNLSEWKAALRQVAEVTGHVYKEGYQSDFIRLVVDDAKHLANPATLDIPSHVVGETNRFRELASWVQDSSHDKRIALLHGAHGIGKKTIAAVVCKQNSMGFEATAFLDNVGEKTKQPDGIVKLQSQLLTRLRKSKGRNNECLSILEGRALIKEALNNNPVLIVLADLDQPEQLINLIQEAEWLEKGSKVIVTSVNKNLVEDHLCVKFPVGSLTPSESLELFSWHVFGTARPVEEHEGRIVAALRYCCGIPSVLKAFASFFSMNMDDWDMKLNTYLSNHLEASIDSLDEDDKKLFFDIACFYVGKDHDHVDSVLNNCNRYKKGGFHRLQTRHLVSVDGNNKVTMDQPTIDMGREVVRKKASFMEKRSNIWSSEDASHLFRKCNGTKHVTSFVYDSKLEDSYSTTEMEFKTQAFAGMTELKLLQLVNIKLIGDFNDFPKDLVWLSWEGMSSARMPENISLEDLAVLDLRNSGLQELWSGSLWLRRLTSLVNLSRLKIVKLNNLKVLNLSHSLLLEKTPDFNHFDVPNLERLMLEGCILLVEIHPSIEVLSSLIQLSLKGCIGLKELPMLGPTVKLLDISSCTGLRTMPRRIKSVKELCADQIAVNQLRTEPFTFGFSFFTIFPSLVKLSLVNCKLSDETFFIGNLVQLQSLQDLDLSRNLFTSMTEALGAFPSLLSLSLEECEHLEVVGKLPNGLQRLNLINCKLLRKIEGVVRPEMDLYAVGCEKLVQVGEGSRLVEIRKKDVRMVESLNLYKWKHSAASYTIEMANTHTGLITRTPVQEQQLLFHCGILSLFVRGSKVPKWYQYKTDDTSRSLCLKRDVDSRGIIGINLCVVYKSREDNYSTSFPVQVDLLMSNKSRSACWVYSPAAYAMASSEEMTWFSHWRLAGHIVPGDCLEVRVVALTEGVEVTRIGVCWASEDEATRPIRNSRWYRKLDVDLSTYKQSDGRFDLINKRHRCSMMTRH